MTTEKYKIWDSQKQEWFKPIYPGFEIGKNNKQIPITETKEIFFSQSGEIYLYECKQGEPPVFTHIPVNTDDKEAIALFIPCVYSGVKDINERKLYVGDLITNGLATWEVVFNSGCFAGKYISKFITDKSGECLEIPKTSFERSHIALRALKGIEYCGHKLEPQQTA